MERLFSEKEAAASNPSKDFVFVATIIPLKAMNKIRPSIELLNCKFSSKFKAKKIEHFTARKSELVLKIKQPFFLPALKLSQHFVQIFFRFLKDF